MAGSRLVLRGGTLVDGTGAPAVPDAAVVIEDNRVVYAGPAAAAPLPEPGTRGAGGGQPGVRVLDTTGQTMLPGLINCHAHLCWDGYHGLQEQSLNDPPAMVAFKAAMNMRRALQAGVTGVRDVGCPHGVAFVAKAAVAEGIVPGPRLWVSGEVICITGGHTFWIGCECDGPEEVRKGVRKQLKQGADCIKLVCNGSRAEAYVKGGAMWGTGNYPEFTFEEIKVACDEAHMVERRVAAHATQIDAAKWALRAGIDTLEHGGTLDAEANELAVERGIYIVPTLSPLYLQAERGLDYGLLPHEVESRRRRAAEGARARNLVESIRAGVKIAMGTDAGSPAAPHDAVAEELVLLVRLGLARDAVEAIMISTRRSAEAIGVADRLGTLEPGKLADVLVVEGNAADDVTALRHVRHVILDGTFAVGG